ncbi:MAG: LCP family protein [Geminocystis sp.]|nr:LCP family protein [Geminocystis sp.]MCS7148826.1 LCP family protein [Geminocystis sp.]MDW8115910.1 LCP family protein [Geminocystis sp.]MDW8463749.1 LCP family protein [Geminocystis sp.]
MSYNKGPGKKHEKFSWRWVLLGLAFGGIAVGSASLGALLALSLSHTPLSQRKLTPAEAAVFNQEETISFDSLNLPKLSRPVNILVLGIKVLTSDLPEKPPSLGYHALVNSFEGLSDSMLLVRFDPEEDSVTVLSIPRDTKVLIPGRGMAKINEANAIGGPAKAAETVSLLLDNVPIDRYVRINIQGVEKLIDALGGITIDVPQDMKYTDHSQHLYIDLKKGKQHLDGKKAIDFLRFRHDAYGDIGRVQRQQSFMRALIEQTLNPKTILRMPEILKIIRAHIDTNLTTNELIALAAFAAQRNRADIKMLLLPGDFNSPRGGELSYWLPNYSKIREIMAFHFGQDSGYYANYRDVEPRRIRIAVQCAEENREYAQQLVQFLQENGYRRSYLSSSWLPETPSKTRIIAQQGDSYAAAKLRADIGIGEVVVESTGVLNSDVTIQVGGDWQNFSSPTNQLQSISY